MSALRNIFKSGGEEESSATGGEGLASASQTGTTGNPLVGDNTTGGHLGDRSLVSGRESTGSNLGTHGSAANGLTGDRVGSGENRFSSGTVGSTGSSSATEKLGLFGSSHKHGHENSLASKFDPSAESTTHDHKHLQHVTHREVHHHEVEEVERQREHHRHIHHVQHHVQPVLDEQRPEEVHHQKSHPITRVTEQHVNTDEDRTLFAGLGEKHRDQETHLPKQRTVVDKGERVNEIVHHHVHHITQPVVRQSVHDRHRIHTVIPTHHVTHESPIIHKSSLHEPVHMTDFLKGGGKLGSGIGHHQAGVLQDGECSRSVDGVGERLSRELGLGSIGSHSHSSTLGNEKSGLMSSTSGNSVTA